MRDPNVEIKQQRQALIDGMTPERASDILQMTIEVLNEETFFALAFRVEALKVWLEKQQRKQEVSV